MLAFQTDEKQNHTRVPPPLLRLEKHTIFIPTFGTCFMCSRKGWIRTYIFNNTSSFTDMRYELVSIDSGTISQLRVRAISALVKQPLIFFIFLWVQHVVALGTKSE